MKRHCASQNPTILEIAQVLGVQPDTVLRWIIDGRMLVALQGPRTVVMVDENQTLRTPDSGKILILTKQTANQRWLAFSC